ncbi:MAG: PKD domain-containing protein, partial [Myxococcota bacterium]|nr:PKD domain-containing protein [Myxococcota bacterium]
QVVDPGSADTFTYAWVFGDGTANGTTATVSHTYVDNGSFIAALTATDDDGAAGTDEALITVVNVAPSITSTAPTSAAEGSAYSYSLTFVDPGVSDTHACSAVTQPSGATLAGCDVTWTPTSAQAGAPARFELCVTDDDDGRSCQQFSVTISFLDSDGDGLADSWETLWFASIAAQDQFGDPDSDGLSNAVEFAAGSNPTLYDGPSAPGAQAPACGSTVSSLQPTLSVLNATDPQGASLLYTFELYSDAALTQLVASNDAVAAGTTSTSWQVPSLLVENRSYFWRTKARDANVSGNYTAPACALRVNVADELPCAPAHDSPDLGASVATLQPTLSVQNANDPDGDVLTYEFEVRLAEVVAASATGVAQTSGVTSWQVSTPLLDSNTYRWRARASSAGGSGPWSPFAQFTVRASFAAAGEPVIVSPQNGTVVDSLSPTLVFLPSGGSSPFDWQLASDDSFATLTASGEDSTATAVTLPQPLVEDGRYCWRVRSDNGATQSAWVKACFRVSAVDDAPTVPTPFNPAVGSVVTTASPVFTWAAATDPEGEAVSYQVELTRGSEVKVISGVGGTAAVSAEPLTNGAYSWRVRAVAGGGSSAYSTPSAFSVAVPPVDDQPETNGCGGCSSASGAFAPMLLALLGVLRRRRR